MSRTGIKKSEAAKKQRDLKKFGKEIQHEKLKQREMDKKSFSERMHGIKRSEWTSPLSLVVSDTHRLQSGKKGWILVVMTSLVSKWTTRLREVTAEEEVEEGEGNVPEEGKRARWVDSSVL